MQCGDRTSSSTPTSSPRARPTAAPCSAQLYVPDAERRADLVPRLARDLVQVDGVDLAMYRAGDEAVVAARRGELRFAPGDDHEDERGGRWSVAGATDVLSLRFEDGSVTSPSYPDPLARVWSALGCPNSGDVLISAGGGYEFTDWGGVAHVGGGSHGSLHRGDSLGVLLYAGTGPPRSEQPPGWRI